MTGRRRSRLRRVVEKPPLGASLHCIGVRIALRSGSDEVLAHADLVAVADDRRPGQAELAARRPSRSGDGRCRASVRAVGGCPGRTAACPDRGRTRRTPRRARGRPAGRGRPRRGCAGTSPTGTCRAGPASRPALAGSGRPRWRARARKMRWLRMKLNSIGRRSPSPKYSSSCLRVDVGLGEDHGVAAPPRQLATEVVEPREVLARCGLVRRGELDDERGGVEPEAGHAELQPEADDLLDLLADPGIGHVEVGLEVVEAVVVPGAGLLVEGPGRVLVAGEHHPLAEVARLVLRPHVPVAVRRRRVATRRLEPRVLVGRVVDDEVDDHPDAAVVGLVDQLDEVAERAERAGARRSSR